MSETYSYDEIPYETHSYVLTHPAQLGAIARLFGVAAAPAEHARVLELGCAEGWNVISSACALPDAPHVGVDLGKVHIDGGQAASEALGLTNLALLQGDFREAPATGQFDYIIAHGLLSWVKPELADELLARAHALLAPGGVFYVSFNCLPGWNARRTLRDAMRFRTRKIEDGNAKVDAALDYLQFLAAAAPPTEENYRAFLQHESRDLMKMPVSYLRHDHLEDDNHALYITDLVARAGAAGLNYIGDASLRAHAYFTLPPRVLNALGAFKPDRIDLDQHCDFITNRSFRRALFVRNDTPHHDVFPRMDDDVVADLWVSSAAERAGAPQDNVFVWGASHIERPSWSLTRALDILGEEWPRSVRIQSLFERIIGGGKVADPAAERARFFGEIISCVGRGLMEIGTCGPRSVNVSGQPRASALSRHMVAAGRTIVANMRHDSVQLDPIERFIVTLLDGTRTHEDLRDALIAASMHGVLPLPVPVAGAQAMTPTAYGEQLAADLDRRLFCICKLALLEA